MHEVVTATSAEARRAVACAWLTSRAPAEEVVVLGATSDAAGEVIRAVIDPRTGAGFGWHRTSLGRLAAEYAQPLLVARGLAPVGALPITALCARVLRRLPRDGRLAAVAEQPGVPRALGRTLTELRQARVTAVSGDAELTTALALLDEELARARLADRALVFALATEAAARPGCAGRALLAVDLRLRAIVERDFVVALLARAPASLVTIAGGDRATVALLGAPVAPLPASTRGRALERVQANLFAQNHERGTLDDSVAIFSAPGESRECVEIARRVLTAAGEGVPFDRMAVLLRSPEHYRVHVEEAMSRAGVPVHFARGTVMPDPAGRAFLALLRCATERLSARRFAEYLSLGEVPAPTSDGEPPPAAQPSERWVPPDEDLLPRAIADAALEARPLETSGTLRTPARWERLLVEAAVIGGRDRWERRLAGLAERFALDDESGRDRSREREDLERLRAFALPLLDELAALPARAVWRTWIDRLSALATRALRQPERVLATLAAFAPMAEDHELALAEVELVLEAQLAELVVRPTGRRYGKLLVASIDDVRGLVFDRVFVPGLAERMFPQKVVEDPLLLDAVRRLQPVALPTRDDRLADERLALHLALGAAVNQVTLSYPRIDLDQNRPRVPSFYGLEVLEAAEGVLPSFDELARRADITGAARIGWPAPADRLTAIDEAEHDLAMLDALLGAGATAGGAHYLLDANPHLARALRFRARRWTVSAWKSADGLIATSSDVLAKHQLDQRSYSPTTLEQLAACPYKFALRAFLRLEPRDVPEAIEALDPLERGSLIHEIQSEVLAALRGDGALPVTPASLATARARLDDLVTSVSERYRERLFPAIDRVWRDGIDAIRADLYEWLRRMSEDTAWVPARFELAFGPVGREVARDVGSTDTAVTIAGGLALRGSIDLVEQSPDGAALRASDSKTGRATVKPGSIIGGGASLQPVLYALVLEQLFPGTRIEGGRLYYCTTRGEFTSIEVPLHDGARAAARVLVDTLDHHLVEKFFPAAPSEKACRWCDYQAICGPHEERRVKGKAPQRLVQLQKLRAQR